MLLRPSQPDDIPQLLELMNNQYARKKDHEYFLWQYFNSPYPTILICAEENEKIIGMFGLQKRRLTNGMLGGQAIDMLIHPDYRNKGIFYKLGSIAFNHFSDLDFLFVLPNLNGKNAIVKNFEFLNISHINNMVLSAPEYKIVKSGLEYHTEIYKYKFEYSEKELQWRFKLHPEYKYSKIEIDAMNYAFIKVFNEPISNIKYGDIVYFESNGSNKFDNLIERCCKILFSANISLITTWSLVDNVSTKALKKIGFKEVYQERYFCIKTINRKMEDLYDINNWVIYQSDAEFY